MSLGTLYFGNYGTIVYLGRARICPFNSITTDFWAIIVDHGSWGLYIEIMHPINPTNPLGFEAFRQTLNPTLCHGFGAHTRTLLVPPIGDIGSLIVGT